MIMEKFKWRTRRYESIDVEQRRPKYEAKVLSMLNDGLCQAVILYPLLYKMNPLPGIDFRKVSEGLIKPHGPLCLSF
jgi:hypothetical protein